MERGHYADKCELNVSNKHTKNQTQQPTTTSKSTGTRGKTSDSEESDMHTDSDEDSGARRARADEMADAIKKDLRITRKMKNGKMLKINEKRREEEIRTHPSELLLKRKRGGLIF